ncbi:MAG: GNAT family N-acetyltransferase [Betaproteobacteria bacterium]|nr:MAG: GNAT family N-acetyltransferase [Betaproteobacteria bacterium]
MRSRNATAPEFSAAYPAHLVASWPLGVAHSITVRPIRPEDIDLETAFAQKLSKETRYNRFLGGGVRLTAEMLEKFTRIDFSRDMALMATATIEGAETAIGVARYVRLADGVSCEFAITIADAWQGRGIGRKLLAMLVDSAPGHGLRKIIGDVLATNTPMLHLARSQRFRIERHPEGAELRRVVLELA